jgi:uncharacterized membrane protein YcaP (DUF421 family)
MFPHKITLLIDLLGMHAKELLWYQMLVRALVVFVFAIVFIRMAGVRSFGTKSAFDIVLSITLGTVLSRCITGHYPFFATLSAALFLAVLHRITAFVSYKYKTIDKLTEGKSVLLFKDGKVLEKSLSKYSITEKNLIQAIHKESIDDFEKVKTMWLEPDGKISVVKKQ